MDARKLSNKERMELFQSGVSQLTTENDVSNVRQLLRQRYLKTKEEEDEVRRKKEEEENKLKKAQEETKGREIDRSQLGKQLARVFRFGDRVPSSSTTRHRGAQRGGQRQRPEVDPFDDPNVLMQNFGWDNDDPLEGGQFLGDGTVDPEDAEEDDDTFLGLLRFYTKGMTRARILWVIFKLSLYLVIQAYAYKSGWGAVAFGIGLLVFICTNLRNRQPGELSAYSVFNPFFASIPSTVGREQPQDNIVLLGGNL